MASPKSFELSVVTPEGPVLTAEAREVVFPAYDGEYGILPNHSPLLSMLGVGELRVRLADGSAEHLYVDGGFVQMVDNRLILLTEQASHVSELSAEEADRLLEEARAMTATDEATMEARERAYERARVQRRLARKVIEPVSTA